MDVHRLAGSDNAIKREGYRDFLGVLARAPGGNSEIVRRAAAVVGTLSEDIGLVIGGNGTIREHVELRNRAIRERRPDEKYRNGGNCAIVEMRVGLCQENAQHSRKSERCQDQRLPFQEMEILNRAKGQDTAWKNKGPGEARARVIAAALDLVKPMRPREQYDGDEWQRANRKQGERGRARINPRPKGGECPGPNEKFYRP